MATTLSFTKNGDVWQAEATVTGDYNLHLERKADGTFNIFQRGTATGQWKVCSGMPSTLNYNAGQVIDWAFGHGVYPEGGLHILIVSGSEVTSGTLSEGAQVMGMNVSEVNFSHLNVHGLNRSGLNGAGMPGTGGEGGTVEVMPNCLLLEDGGALLLEDGTPALLENLPVLKKRIKTE